MVHYNASVYNESGVAVHGAIWPERLPVIFLFPEPYIAPVDACYMKGYVIVVGDIVAVFCERRACRFVPSHILNKGVVLGTHTGCIYRSTA